MARNRGEHLERKEVKIEIIKFILSRSKAVKEPDIRNHLEEKYGITDQSNVRKHLKDLYSSNYSCIEKIPAKPGLANYWDVKNIDNLKNISLHFPEIQLNEYNKSVNIVLKMRYCSFAHLKPSLFKSQLAQSTSFFKIYLETEPENLYAKATLIYRLGVGHEKYEKAKKELGEILVLYLKNHPGVEISEETVMKMPIKLSEDIFTETLQKSPKELSQEIRSKIANVLFFREEENLLTSNLIFQHFLNNDILTGDLSLVAIESFFRAKEKYVGFEIKPKRNPTLTAINWELGAHLDKDRDAYYNLPYLSAFWPFSSRPPSSLPIILQPIASQPPVFLQIASQPIESCPTEACLSESIKRQIQFYNCWSEESKKLNEYRNELDKWKKETPETDDKYNELNEKIPSIMEIL